ncbi:MAG: D-alanine--D-alanine ligase [Proteobacteria bacterium]|nr:D-alanine--D-alanine ligase [Desulfobulbaceae bacterium]MBU4153309.1 D-alanine--D-alanine ligase [Pseudomonadota bacterium]MDP2106374.1 D-alanine--D-alanine ligase [Desulfobulbaceae bacterium]
MKTQTAYKHPLRVALLAGGKSGEREVSLAGATEVEKALDPKKYQVKRYDPAIDMARIAHESGDIDVVFILLHGRFGEDGTVQGFLDLLGLPYQGSGVLGSALAMDKDAAKTLYQVHGLPVSPWRMARQDDAVDPRQLLAELSLPLVVKPVRQGSSLGMSIAHTPEELAVAIAKAFTFDREVMVEQYVQGREITVGVIGNDDLTALPLVEIIPGEGHPFFDYQAKYQAGASREICPAQVSESIRILAQKYAIRAHRALKLKGYSRTDMIITDSRLVVLETNTIPGMTPTSLLPQAAAVAGLSFSALLDRLVELALEEGVQGANT